MTDYVLDFGYVVSDTIREVVFQATNCGYFPVSFSADKQTLHNSGFNIHLDRVKNLPGYPEPDSVAIAVTFDPKASNISQGIVEARVPINVCTLIVSKVHILIAHEKSNRTLCYCLGLCQVVRSSEHVSIECCSK